ncbi:MAG: GNAT family N-acetyltransferase [Beijerinckiaceae bacterium]|nr:GNAT family N-acetyltransferase [Beijerinckiaceae bacterium]
MPTRESPPARIVLRAPRPGDYGWIIARHGAVYAAEYGWDIAFEGLVAGLVADFVASHDPARERCWIADLGGQPVGSVFCTRQDDDTAKLRMLIVDEQARGHGAGGLLVDTCMAFAREAGYRKMTLWTNDILTAARKLYAARGWRLASAEAVHQFGQAMVSETWEVEL